MCIANDAQAQRQGSVRAGGLRAQAFLQFPWQAMLQGGEQGPGDCVAGVAEHLPDRALFDDPALFEHHHAVADITDHRHLVGDQDHRQAQALVDVLEQAEDRFGGFRVQRRGGFVAQQYFRVVYQRAGNAHALFLAAGQLRRVGVVLVLQAHQLQ
ncbi:hypothetical protein D3C80_1615890 [compost metagenome]